MQSSFLFKCAARSRRRVPSAPRRELSTSVSRPTLVEILGQKYPVDEVSNVTSAVLSKVPLRLHTHPSHPLGILRGLIESHFPTYTAISSLSPLVTPYKNFEELNFPTDHPGRSVSDSYYVNKNLMLRTHTSAHEVETFSHGETRWLLTADVYRRDEIDASHYPVFHQMEGARLFANDTAGIDEVVEENARLAQQLAESNIVIDDNTQISPSNPIQLEHDPRHARLVADNLKHNLNSLILKLFGNQAGATKENPLQVRWIEAYFPWTSPSYEVEVMFGGKWLEILGCGVVRQSTLDRSNVCGKIGWAFGLGLERIAMVLFGIPDIRLFWSTDSRFLSQFSESRITPFKSYSKYPACFKDTSFWLPSSGLHENDFCDLVRVVAGDLVEDVKLIDSFTHPKTNRSSQCYRINYRSMDRSLTNDEVNELQSEILQKLIEEFGVVIR